MAQERDAQPTDGRSSFRSTLSSLLARSPPAGRGGTRLPTLQQQVRTAHPATKACGTRTTCSTLLCTLVALACTLHRMRTASVASSPAIASWPVAQARTKRRHQPPFMNRNFILGPFDKGAPNSLPHHNRSRRKTRQHHNRHNTHNQRRREYKNAQEPARWRGNR